MNNTNITPAHLLKGFEKSISSNIERATKEVWVLSDRTPSVYKSQNFIVRYLMTSPSMDGPKGLKTKIAKVLFWARRDCRTILLTNDLTLLWRALPKIVTEWLSVLM